MVHQKNNDAVKVPFSNDGLMHYELCDNMYSMSLSQGVPEEHRKNGVHATHADGDTIDCSDKPRAISRQFYSHFLHDKQESLSSKPNALSEKRKSFDVADLGTKDRKFCETMEVNRNKTLSTAHSTEGYFFGSETSFVDSIRKMPPAKLTFPASSAHSSFLSSDALPNQQLPQIDNKQMSRYNELVGMKLYLILNTIQFTDTAMAITQYIILRNTAY